MKWILDFGPKCSSSDQICIFPHNIKNTHTRYMYMHTWMHAYFSFNWLGQWSGKTLLTVLHKYFYQNGKAFPSHPEHAKIPLALPSLCRASTLHYDPILPALPGELNRSDGCATSPEAPGQVRAHTSPSLNGPSSLSTLGAASAGMPWILHGKLSKWSWETSPSDQNRVSGKGRRSYYTRLKQEESDGIWEAANVLEQKFKTNFVVAKFRLLPWGISLQGFLLWEIKW